MRQLSWWHYVTLTLMLLLVLSVWAVPLRGWHPPISTDTFFAEIGALMGAIFTAGGLVLAIAALITLVTVESKAREAATEVLQQVRTEMDADLTAALTAYDYLSSARNSINRNNLADLRDAERLVEAAIEMRPDVPQAREWIAVVLYGAAFRYFLIHHFDNKYGDIQIAAGSETDFYTNAHNAVRWLREIIERAKDESPKIEWKACLASAYGLAGNAEDMLRTVAEIPEARREAAFASPRYRLSLAAGLRSAAAKTNELHSLLPGRFPVPVQAIRDYWLDHRAKTPSINARVGLWALRKAAMPNTPST